MILVWVSEQYPIAEAMVAIVLLDHLLRFKAQCK